MPEKTEKAPDLEGWIGRKVHLRYSDADVPRWLDCTLDEVGEHGVCVSAGDKTSFFPWSSVIKMDLVAAETPGGSGR